MPQLLYEALTYAIIGAATPAPAAAPLAQVLVWKSTASSAQVFLRPAQDKSRGRLPGRSFDRLRTGLEHELTLRGIPFERQKRLAVVYKDQIIGEYIADLVIDGKVIPSTKLRTSLELKAVSDLHPAHEAQAHHYITATGLRLALLINPSTRLRASFGAPSLEWRRIIR